MLQLFVKSVEALPPFFKHFMRLWICLRA